MEAVAAEARPAAVPAYEEALDWGYEEPEEEEVSPQQPVDSKVGWELAYVRLYGGEAGLWESGKGGVGKAKGLLR